jgi:hypothetical protein
MALSGKPPIANYGGYSLVGAPQQDGTGAYTYRYRNDRGQEFKTTVPSRGQDHSSGRSVLIEFDPDDQIVEAFNAAGIFDDVAGTEGNQEDAPEIIPVSDQAQQVQPVAPTHVEPNAPVNVDANGPTHVEATVPATVTANEPAEGNP